MRVDRHVSREETCQKAHGWWIPTASVIAVCVAGSLMSPESPVRLSRHLSGLPVKKKKKGEREREQEREGGKETNSEQNKKEKKGALAAVA